MMLQHITVVNVLKLSHKNLQNVATSANKWCENNQMKLSIIKTKVALVGSKQKVNRLTDSDKQIK